MKRRFMTWYVAKREKHNGVPEPPTLPSPRSHFLTPSPSMEALSQSQQNALFFQMLPYEIRKQILTEAFGDRTIHVDLAYSHPSMPGSNKAHAMIQEWSTNTIHISSATLLVDLTAYILPQRLSSIRSLEIIWFVETDVCIGKSLPRDKDLNAILLTLDNHFPKLKRLNLALKLGLSKNVETHYQYLFDILDKFFMRRVSDSIQEPFAVSIPYTVYVEMRREIVRAQHHEGNVFHWQIWRSFGGEYVLPQKPWVTESFDTTPGVRSNNGYWIYPATSTICCVLLNAWD
ncbi:hypothetical protein FDENT_241 [Fusarium denticulatum]|uniref:Uncharacterized protein n=1 Tax=Fusarium denticulatum TaxID=48507 RepID=A0A8H5XLC4_9HYPO|nr:hypothetical protein FDENT_241 [Fusarium denticulatum]